MPDLLEEAKRLSEALELALARLREGTEVLRTGGGTSLTAEQCNLLLDDRAELVARLEQAERALLGAPTPDYTAWQPESYRKWFRGERSEALAAQQREDEGG